MLTDAERKEVGNILEDGTVNPKTLAWLCCKLLELNRIIIQSEENKGKQNA